MDAQGEEAQNVKMSVYPHLSDADPQPCTLQQIRNEFEDSHGTGGT